MESRKGILLECPKCSEVIETIVEIKIYVRYPDKYKEKVKE